MLNSPFLKWRAEAGVRALLCRVVVMKVGPCQLGELSTLFGERPLHLTADFTLTGQQDLAC